MTTAPAPLRVGTLLFEGFELLDVFGPLEMYGMLGERATITMFAEKAGPVRSHQGPSTHADAVFSGDLGLDVLLVPGGFGTRREVLNEPLLAELGRQCASARYVTSVCTGSALLAKSGVLDGRRATTNKFAYAWATSQGPAVNWVPKARWVEDGKFFTSSGVSAGMDMTLGLIERIFGKEASLAAAARAEYDWHQDKDWDPFAKLYGLG